MQLRWIDRYQLDVEVPKQLKRAMQARLIRHPANQVGQSVIAVADLKSVYRRRQRRAQSAFDHDFEAVCTHDGSFRCSDALHSDGVGDWSHWSVDKGTTLRHGERIFRMRLLSTSVTRDGRTIVAFIVEQAAGQVVIPEG